MSRCPTWLIIAVSSILGLLITLLIVGMVASIFEYDTSPASTEKLVATSTPKPHPAPEHSLTAAELISAYEGNKLAAEELYKNKTIVVSGIVDGSGMDLFDDEYISITYDPVDAHNWDVNPWSSVGINCHFPEEDSEEVLQLRGGDPITVRGLNGGDPLFTIVLKPCTILAEKTAPTPTATSTLDSASKPDSPADPTPPSTVLEAEADLVERVESGVVQIITRHSSGIITGYGTGSGFIFDTNGTTAFVVTNHHVIEGTYEITVRVDNSRNYKATLLGYDEGNDVAVMSICCDASFTTLSWQSDVTYKARIGEDVVAIGYPVSSPHKITATKGKVIDDPLGAEHGFLTHDAPIIPGNSGGPLLSLEGKVLGVNTAISTSGEWRSYSVPYSAIKDDVADWKSRLIISP